LRCSAPGIALKKASISVMNKTRLTSLELPVRRK
jgi:hypothetical protein